MDDMLESLELWLQSRMEDVHTMLPGTVQSYDPDTRTAVVKPSVKLRTMHGDILDIPPIASVPVVWPGSNDFTAMSKDLSKGSGVTLLFPKRPWEHGSEEPQMRRPKTRLDILSRTQSPSRVSGPCAGFRRTASCPRIGACAPIGWRSGEPREAWPRSKTR